MNGEREAAPEAGAADEQIFARPAWLEEFGSGAERAPAERSDSAAPGRGVRLEDDDFWDQEPTGWRATVDRVRTTPRAAIALIVVGVIAAVVAAVAVFGTSDGSGSGPYPVVNFAGA